MTERYSRFDSYRRHDVGVISHYHQAWFLPLHGHRTACSRHLTAEKNVPSYQGDSQELGTGAGRTRTPFRAWKVPLEWLANRFEPCGTRKDRGSNPPPSSTPGNAAQARWEKLPFRQRVGLGRSHRTSWTCDIRLTSAPEIHTSPAG